jgi:hypothetical protein
VEAGADEPTAGDHPCRSTARTAIAAVAFRGCNIPVSGCSSHAQAGAGAVAAADRLVFLEISHAGGAVDASSGGRVAVSALAGASPRRTRQHFGRACSVLGVHHVGHLLMARRVITPGAFERQRGSGGPNGDQTESRREAEDRRVE